MKGLQTSPLHRRAFHGLSTSPKAGLDTRLSLTTHVGMREQERGWSWASQSWQTDHLDSRCED